MNIKSFWKLKVPLCALAVCVLLGLALWLLGFRVNLTASLPKGLYRLADEIPERGDLAAFCLESSNPFCGLAKERGYLSVGSCPSGLQPLLKKLAGLPGDYVEVTKAGLTLNGRPLPGTARPERDRLGRALPPSLLKSGFIPGGMAMLLSQEHPGSFDSRHFGLVPLASLQKAETVWLWEKESVVAENIAGHGLQPHRLKKFVRGFIFDAPALIEFFHGLGGLPVRGVQFKGQSFLPGHLGQKNAAGIGNGQAHSSQNIGRLGLDFFTDTRPDDSILNHSQIPLDNKVCSDCSSTGLQKQIGHPTVLISEEIFDAPSRALGVPKSLLMAIARVESNFRPWTLNIEGRSFYFTSREEALGKAREAREAGRSFDIGLMQVNDWWLRKYHIPLETALDPVSSIHIGGWILKQELARHGGDVPAAVGAYHSPTPARAKRYAKLVLSGPDGAAPHQAAPRPDRKAEVRPVTLQQSAPMLIVSKHKTVTQGHSLKASATAAVGSMKVRL